MVARATYVLDPFTGHLAARFTRKVTIIPRTEPRSIYRGGAKVGEWPDRGFSVIIHDVMSAYASTLESAKAIGEHYGNELTLTSLKHVLTPERAAEIVAAEIADRAALMARYPFTPEEVESLKASRYHSDILEPPSAVEIARRIGRLSGARQY